MVPCSGPRPQQTIQSGVVVVSLLWPCLLLLEKTRHLSGVHCSAVQPIQLFCCQWFNSCFWVFPLLFFWGPCECWGWFQAALFSSTLSVCLSMSAGRTPLWLKARFTSSQERQRRLFPSAYFCLFLSFPVSQHPDVCPAWSWAASDSARSDQTIHGIVGNLSPCYTPRLSGEKWITYGEPLKPFLQQQLLGCFLPVSQAGSPYSNSSSVLENQTVYEEQRLCATKGAAQRRKVQYVFILGLSIPTDPSSSPKPYPYPLCSLFMLTFYPINSPFRRAPAVSLSSDHCSGAINPLDCIRLWNIPI